MSGPSTRKSRDLETNPACTLSVSLPGIDLVFEGATARERDPATLERVATWYRDLGWPAEVAGAALTAPFAAPSGGQPPRNVYRFTHHTVIGVASAEPNGATRWRFRRRRGAQQVPLATFPKVCLDTTHCGTAGWDLLEVQRQLGDRVRHVHLSDHANGWQHLVPGEGDLPLGPGDGRHT